MESGLVHGVRRFLQPCFAVCTNHSVVSPSNMMIRIDHIWSQSFSWLHRMWYCLEPILRDPVLIWFVRSRLPASIWIPQTPVKDPCYLPPGALQLKMALNAKYSAELNDITDNNLLSGRQQAITWNNVHLCTWMMPYGISRPQSVNSLRPCDAIWQHVSRLKLAHLMASKPLPLDQCCFVKHVLLLC